MRTLAGGNLEADDYAGEDSDYLRIQGTQASTPTAAAVPAAGAMNGGGGGSGEGHQHTFVPPPTSHSSGGPSHHNNSQASQLGRASGSHGAAGDQLQLAVTHQHGSDSVRWQHALMLVSAPTQHHADEVCQRMMVELDACNTVPAGSIQQLRLCVRKRTAGNSAGGPGGSADVTRPGCVHALATRLADLASCSQPTGLLTYTTYWSLEDYVYIKSQAPKGWDVLLRFIMDSSSSVPVLPSADDRGLPTSSIGHELDKAYAIVTSGEANVCCYAASNTVLD